MAAKVPNHPEAGSADSLSTSLDALEELLGHRFADRGLLELALTHRSVAHERAQADARQDASPSAVNSTRNDNEQLEFLGDAVVGLLVADELYRRFPSLDEGGLTRLRAWLVSRRHLAEVGLRLQLGRYLRLGRGEEQTGGRAKSALLANAVEAVFAAVYLDAGLDGGLAAVRPLVIGHVIAPALDKLVAADDALHIIGDHKSALQQRMQAAGLGTPRYVVTAETGPDHRKHFTVEVHMDAGHMGSGGGPPAVLGRAEAGTKKQAQQEAARLACAHLDALAEEKTS